ncbi:response regulator [bacterium]|nr:response regulator [bacterium]
MEFHILLIEDNPGDVRLTREAFKASERTVILDVCSDGEQALCAFKEIEEKTRDRPHLVILDLNLPKHNGWEILEFVKKNEALKSIPIIVFTSSDAEVDIRRCYEAYANCFIKKPLDFVQYADTIKSIENFWFDIVESPRAKE